jgi:hypothetical protein
MKPKAGLIAILDYRNVERSELDDWYDTEHIPQRLSIPGFLGAQRWESDAGEPVSLVLYDLSDLDVLSGPDYRAVTGDHLTPWSKRVLSKCVRTRFDAELTLRIERGPLDAAGGLLVVAMNVEDDAAADFDAWYDQEHLPSLAALPGVLEARRYRSKGGSRRHIAAYHLADPSVQASEAWKKAIDTPWASRVRPRTRDRVRYVCRRYVRQSVFPKP